MRFLKIRRSFYFEGFLTTPVERPQIRPTGRWKPFHWEDYIPGPILSMENGHHCLRVHDVISPIHRSSRK